EVGPLQGADPGHRLAGGGRTLVPVGTGGELHRNDVPSAIAQEVAARLAMHGVGGVGREALGHRDVGPEALTAPVGEDQLQAAPQAGAGAEDLPPSVALDEAGV